MKSTTPKRSQAERVVSKFGGPRRLSEAMKRVDPSQAVCRESIYRWMHPVAKKGTGGVIPTRVLPFLQRVARIEGVFLSDEDLIPGLR